MSPRDIIEECFDAFPGIAAVKEGLVPLGHCLRGSGDPYFVPADSRDDAPLIKIYHDAVGRDGRLGGDFCRVANESVAHFIATADIIGVG
jgi:hypothetical protein